MVALDELMRRIPPPSPTRGGTVDWNAVQTEVGTTLPEDYKAFIDAYGLGTIDDFLWIYDPLSTSPHLQLQSQVQRQLHSLRLLRDQSGVTIPYALFPDTGGLLPWGR